MFPTRWQATGWWLPPLTRDCSGHNRTQGKPLLLSTVTVTVIFPTRRLRPAVAAGARGVASGAAYRFFCFSSLILLFQLLLLLLT
jgi:hypothetical protein